MDKIHPLDDHYVEYLRKYYDFKALYSLAYFTDIDIDPEITASSKRAARYAKNRRRAMV